MTDKTCATCVYLGAVMDEDGWLMDEVCCQLDDEIVTRGDTCEEWHNRDYTCDDCPWAECLAPMSCAGYRRWLCLDNPATSGPRAKDWQEVTDDGD